MGKACRAAVLKDIEPELEAMRTFMKDTFCSSTKLCFNNRGRLELYVQAAVQESSVALQTKLVTVLDGLPQHGVMAMEYQFMTMWRGMTSVASAVGCLCGVQATLQESAHARLVGLLQ